MLSDKKKHIESIQARLISASTLDCVSHVKRDKQFLMHMNTVLPTTCTLQQKIRPINAYKHSATYMYVPFCFCVFFPRLIYREHNNLQRENAAVRIAKAMSNPLM